MKKLLVILPLVFLLCFVFSCQKQGEEMAAGGLTEEEVNAMMGDVIKVWNNADMDACDRVYSADYVEHDPLEGDIVGIDAFKERIRTLQEQLSSFNLSSDEIFVKNDKFAVLWTVKETLMNGAQVESSGVSIGRVVDGKIAEVNYYYDTKKALEQMGYKIIPPEETEEK